MQPLWFEMLLIIGLLSDESYKVRMAAQHELKIRNDIPFSLVLPYYKVVNIKKDPETKLALKDILKHKWEAEMTQKYTTDYDVILTDTMWNDFRRELGEE